MRQVTCKNQGFTLAEILIALGVIGVVTAVTVPILLNKINEKKYDNAREKALNTVGEAIKQIIIEGNIASESTPKGFVDNLLSKKIKIIKTCEVTTSKPDWSRTNLEKCGLSKSFKNYAGTSKDMPLSIQGQLSRHDLTQSFTTKNTPSYGFVTIDGYSYNLFYNPNCTKNNMDYKNKRFQVLYGAQNFVCVSVIYDMNGLKNPNRIGEDMGIVTVMYPDETVKAVAPKKPIVKSNNEGCGDGYRLLNVEEAIAYTFNGYLYGLNDNYIRTSDKNRYCGWDHSVFVHTRYGNLWCWSAGDNYCIKN